jgi:hypothetical protein
MVGAVAPILARTGGAFIYVNLTGIALKAFQALALVAAGADQINADASIEASFLSNTAIHILAAVFPFPALRAFTDKSSDLVLACASILTRSRPTVIDVLFTCSSVVAKLALAGKAFLVLEAWGTIPTGV